METLRDQNIASTHTDGISLEGCINATYNQLLEVLGEPTFNTSSGDDKRQVEWVVKFGNSYFTIYDYKTYDREYTLNELDEFHIGGKTDALDFINELENKLNENR
jgi:hypothetical protein